ncbi:MAG: hypothetical protein PWR01_291 [Clostridiales bacterium]|nr:hypothetical protein [Clostridiales bacterium]
MKKSEFLRELKYNLMGKVSDEELENIIMDYDEIFESGKADGKAEDEISDMLGSPALVAKAILDEYPNNNTSKMGDENTYSVAPLGKRVVAFIIDSVLSLIPLVLLSIIGERPRLVLFSVFPMMIYNPIIPVFLMFSFFNYIRPQPHVVYPHTESIVLVLAGFVFFWLYGTLVMIMMRGRTIGMRLMGIKVVKKDRSALKPLDIAVRQFIGKVLLAGLTWNISYIVSFFWAVFSKTNNTVHDKLAGTMVVEDR